MNMIRKNIEKIILNLKQILVTINLYLAEKGNKLLIIVFLYTFIVATAIFVCIFSIIPSDKALFLAAEHAIVYKVEEEAAKQEQLLIKVEKSAEGLSNFILVTFDTKKFDNLPYIKSYTENLLTPAVKQYFNNTHNTEGMYVYLDIDRTKRLNYVAEAWATNDNLKIRLNKDSYTKEDPSMHWYYNILSNQKAQWIEPYWDQDLGKIIITYAKPVYKSENSKSSTFIAGAGIDLTSTNLINNINQFKMKKTGYAFLVSKNYYFIASKEYSINHNLFTVKNGYYKPLLNIIKNQESGLIKLDKNYLAFSRLYNGYTFFISIHEEEIIGHIKHLNTSLIGFTFFAIFLVTCLMIILLKRLNYIMDSLETSDNIIMTIANSIEAKDEYTKGHIERVSTYAEKLGKYFKLPNSSMEQLKKASMLHDIGKIGIPDNILNKKGKLTKEEFEIIKKHSEYGAKILKPLKAHKELLSIVRHHHEKLDGSGYPDGLKAEEINLQIRIITVLDIYDALITQRSYKQAFSIDEAFKILDEEVSKGLLDKDVVEGLKFILENEPKV